MADDLKRVRCPTKGCDAEAAIRRNRRTQLLYLVCDGCGTLHYNRPAGQARLRRLLGIADPPAEAPADSPAEPENAPPADPPSAPQSRPTPAAAGEAGGLLSWLDD